MSLFPAYGQNASQKDGGEDSLQRSWLQNDSCPSEISVTGSFVEPGAAAVSNIKADERTDDYQFNSSERDESLDSEKGHDHYKSLKKKKNAKRPKHKSKEKYRSRKKKKTRHKSRSPSCRSRSRSPSHRSKLSSSKIENHRETKSLIPVRNQNKDVFLEGVLTAITPENVIYFDYVGDNNNRIFGTTHYTQFAKYYVNRKTMLGCYPSKNKKKQKKIKRYFSLKSRLKFLEPSVVCVSEKENELNTRKEFLFIPCAQQKSTHSTMSYSNPLNILDPATASYILGKDKEPDNSSTKFEEIKLSYWQTRSKEYNESLNKEPHNIALWLQFIRFQDKASDFWFDTECKSKTETNRTRVAERKVAILDSAIEKNEHGVSLYWERLVVGQEIWNSDKLLHEWDALVNEFPNDLKVWEKFLVFYRTYFPTFHLNNVAKTYYKYKERLLQLNQRQFDSPKLSDNSGYLLIDSVSHLAYIWRQGGFMEKAIALFQALIEINLFCPPQLKEPNVNKELVIDVFEAFWDSKAPRFGCKDSVGWAKFIERKETVSFPEEILEGSRDEEDDMLSRGGEKNKLWLDLELSRELNHWLPWQRDPDTCEDPERIVDFSEIRQHVFIVEKEEERFYLILQFLSFLGVTVPASIHEACNFQVSKCLPGLQIETLQDFVLGQVDTDIVKDNDLFYFPTVGPSVRRLSSEHFFEFICQVIYISMSLFTLKYKILLAVILINLFNEKCTSLKKGRPELFQNSVKHFRKNIRSLFKKPEFRNSLEVYYEFAQFEKNLGYYEDAFRIHAMSLALGMQGEDVFSGNAEASILLKHIISTIKIEFIREAETMNKHHIQSVQNIICSVTIDRKFSYEQNPYSSNVLKAKKKLGDLKIDILHRMKFEPVNPLTVSFLITVLSILQFITSGYEAAYSEFENTINELNLEVVSDQKTSKDLEKAKEFLYENFIWFLQTAPLFRHISPTLPVSPVKMRNLLDVAVKLAPSNLFLLTKLSYCQFPLWRDILSRVRHMDDDEDQSILVIIFQLIPHIRKAVDVMAEPGGNALSYHLRSILEYAVSTITGRHCPLLWRLYLRITQQLSPQSIKALIYRAINNCPFAKCVYMDCIRLVPESLTEIVKVMGEKGLRIRLPIEELDVLLENEDDGNHDEKDDDDHNEKDDDDYGENNDDKEAEDDGREDVLMTSQ